MSTLIQFGLAFAAIIGAGYVVRAMQDKTTAEKDKSVRNHLSEKQLDKMVMDSFPASDAPSTY